MELHKKKIKELKNELKQKGQEYDESMKEIKKSSNNEKFEFEKKVADLTK